MFRQCLRRAKSNVVREQSKEALDKTVKGAEQVAGKVREATEEAMAGGRKFWDRLKDSVMEESSGKAEKVQAKAEEAEEKVKQKLEDRGYNK